MRVDAARDKRAGVALAGRFRAAWKMTRLAGASCRWGYGFAIMGTVMFSPVPPSPATLAAASGGNEKGSTNPMTQHLSERDVRGIAEYTRIGLTDDEVAQMTVDLNAIIDS